ncbi:MAG: protein kinase [Polyangiaceae bacterium]|nr:protein kinase [Polyangiaceae bacterium]
MTPGELLAERFLIEAVAATGGMGEILRARDVDTDARVAIKVMIAASVDRDRFEREARVLRKLEHPRIVRYLGHGETPGGAPYLAMEWLDGEDLEHRLSERGLSTDETLAMTQGVAEALAHAHAQGIVHRDIKPSNVFLVGGRPDSVKLIDFGIARGQARTRALTRPGAVVGTAGYMAPEQASGSEVGPQADVFGIGCILFECLTGRPAFDGATPLAVLAKLLLGDPPRVRDIRPSISTALDELTQRLMRREPSERPADAGAVLEALSDVASVVRATSIPAPAPARPSLGTRAEQRLYSLVLCQLRAPSASPDATVSVDDASAAFAPLREAAEQLGGQIVSLGPVGAALALESRGSATDQAELAARVALGLFPSREDVVVAIATGTAESTARGPSGPVVDRASHLLELREPRGIRIDEVTRSLLRSSFEIRGDREPFLLVSEHAHDAGYFLLGKPSPCVGRDRELALLEASLAEALDERVLRAVLVSAPPGTGKSRLIAEHLARARAAHAELRVIVARAEPARARSALGLARQLVCATAGISAAMTCGEDARARGEMLRAHLAELGATDAPWAPFLGLLAGADIEGGEAGPTMLAAQHDPIARRSGIRDAFVAYLDRWSSRGPALIVLEDLHWCDPGSFEHVVAAAQRLAQRPLLLVAVARPDVSETFPSVGRDLGALELRLSGLTKRAAEKLVRSVLGETAPVPTVDRIVALSDGNAFYLEELIRFVAEGRGNELPASVVAMAQVRLLGLEDADRELIRAASVFGERFDAASVAVLMQADDVEVVRSRLERLCRSEILERSDNATYGFRHALLLSAAYGMFPDEERRAAHLHAATHLIARNEPDPALVAAHFVRGRDPQSAVPWLVRGAHAALDGGDLADARKLAQQGLDCGATGEAKGHLKAYQAYTAGMSGNWIESSQLSREAVELLPLGSVGWFRAATNILVGDATLGRLDNSFEILQKVTSLEVTPAPTGPYGRTVTMLISILMLFGQAQLIPPLEARLEAASGPTEDAAFPVWRQTTRAMAGMVARGDLGAALRAGTEASRALPSVSDPLLAVVARLTFGRVLGESGLYHRAIEWFEEGEAIARQSHMLYLADWTSVVCAAVCVHQGRIDYAAHKLGPLLDAKNPIIRLLAELVHVGLHLNEGRPAEARELADRVLDESSLPLLAAVGRQMRARAHCALGDHVAALADAEKGLELRARIGGQLVDRSWMQVARCEALVALGRVEEAQAALKAAIAEVDEVTQSLDDPDARRAYREEVAPNARLLAMKIAQQ